MTRRGPEFSPNPAEEVVGDGPETKTDNRNIYRKGLLFGRIAEITAKLLTGEFRVEGKENIPPGPGLVIAHHDSHFDGHALAAALSGESVGVVGYAGNWLFDWLGMRKVRQVTSQLDPKDREELRGLSTQMAGFIEREE